MGYTTMGATAAREPASTCQGQAGPTSHDDTQASPAQLCERHFPLVMSIVGELMQRLPPWTDRDCLVQSGVVGLLDAAQRYDARRAIRFSTYAAYRIRGEIIEYLRSLDVATRTVRAWSRTLTTMRDRLFLRLGREASAQEMATALNVSLACYYHMVRRVDDATLLSLTEAIVAEAAEAATPQASIAPSPSRDPAAEIEHKDMVTKLTRAIAQLPAQERRVLTLYYQDERTLRQIGELLGLTESRISQIHTQAVARLRPVLTSETLH